MRNIGPMAIRQLIWESRKWALGNGWTEDGATWRGSLRGYPTSLTPEREHRGPPEIAIAIAHGLTPQTVTPTNRGTPDVERLTRFFDADAWLVHGMRVRPDDILLWFPPLTPLEEAVNTAEAIVTALITKPATQPFR